MNNLTAGKMRGAVIVTRVSGHEQAEKGTSLENQTEKCRAKALTLGLPIVAEYEDAAISGAFLLARPGMQAALALIRAGGADTLITFNISRYSRDREHQEQIKKAVRGAGGSLVFCDADYADNAAGNLNFNIQGDFAVYEREHLREKSMDGHRARAENGIQTGRATAPFGYIVPKRDDVVRGDHPPEALGKYLLDGERAPLAADLFRLYDGGGQSLNDLAKRMNRTGLPTQRNGRMWRASTIRFILTNPVYKGVGCFGRFDHATDESRLMRTHPRTGLPLTSPKSQKPADPSTWITWEVPALVSEDVWDRVNVRLRENKRLQGGNPQRVRMLAGRVFCPHCGSGMACMSPTRTRSKKAGSAEVFTYPHRYACLRYRQTLMETGEKGCEPTGYYVHEVEAAVISALLEACLRPESVREALSAYGRAQEAPQPARDARQEMSAVDRALAELAQEDLLAVQAQMAGMRAGASPAAYAAVFADLAARRKDMEDRRGVLARALRAPSGKKGGGAEARPDFAELLDRARQVLQSADVAGEVKRDVLGSVVERVVCLKAADKSAGAEVVFLPGVFAEGDGEDTLQSSKEQPEMRRLRAGKCHGFGSVPIGNSDRTAPRPSAISSNRRRFSEG